MKLKSAIKEKDDALFSKNETFDQQNSILAQQINQLKQKIEVNDKLHE